MSKCPDTLAVSYGHFGTGAEESWVRSVLGPKCLYSTGQLRLDWRGQASRPHSEPNVLSYSAAERTYLADFW